MAKIKYNVKGVDTGGGPLPKAGVYRCKVTSCIFNEKPDSGKPPRIEAVYEIQSSSDGDKTHKGYKLYDYVPTTNEEMEWKLAQFIKAMGLPESGSFEPKECVGTGLNVRVRIQPETEQYAAKANPATLIPLDGEEGSDDDEDLSEETEGEETVDGEAEEDNEPWTEEELEGLEKAELKEVAGEFEVDWPKRLTDAGKAKVIAAILEAQGEAEEEEGEEGEDDLWTEEELTELTDVELKGVAFGDPEDDDDEGFGLDESDYVTKKKNPKTKKMVTKFDRDACIAAILEAQEGGEEEGEEEGEGGEEEEAVDYNEMEVADLKALCKERKLDTKGTKKMLVARLEKDDEPF